MTKEPKPVKERDNLNLLELVCQLHFRALNFPSKEMHDAYMEARKELEKRLSSHDVNEDEIIEATIEFCNVNNIPAIPMLTEILRNTIRETKKQLSSPSPVQGITKEANDYDLERLYEWVVDSNRKLAQTAFTSGWARNVAREVEYRFKNSQPITKEGKREYDSNILNHEQIFYDAIDEIESKYPTTVFIPGGDSQDAKSAEMARITCENIRKTYLRMKHEYYASSPSQTEEEEKVFTLKQAIQIYSDGFEEGDIMSLPQEGYTKEYFKEKFNLNI